MRKLACAALATALLAVTPSDPATLPALAGKSVAGVTFAPLDGTLGPLAKPGRPTVVIAFASWCAPCLAEMPRIIADYQRYKDRVDFVGIDYSESPAVARKLIAKYGIPFLVESYTTPESSGDAPMPAAPYTTPYKHTLMLPDTMTREQLKNMQSILGDEFESRALAVYDARAVMTPNDFQAYETIVGVTYLPPKDLAKSVKAAAAANPNTLELPHAFVIDANGNLVTAIRGYNPDVDEIALALLKLGM